MQSCRYHFGKFCTRKFCKGLFKLCDKGALDNPACLKWFYDSLFFFTSKTGFVIGFLLYSVTLCLILSLRANLSVYSPVTRLPLVENMYFLYRFFFSLPEEIKLLFVQKQIEKSGL